MTGGPITVAVVQRPPVLLDREATLKGAVSHLHEAADGGASLVVFPEAYVPGYPIWVWGLRPGGDYGKSDEIHARLLANSVDVSGDDLAPLRDAASDRNVVVVCGVHERDDNVTGSTIYNTLLTIGPDGSILNRHRKLMPTNPERMVWGQGDASGLRTIATDIGRLGTLLCWESYMPLARFALYAEGMEIYVTPTWDSGESWLASMQHIAAEGRCWVVNAGCSLHTDDIPASFPSRDDLYAEPRWLNPGDSAVVAPGGKIVAGPLHQEHGILLAEIDPTVARAERRTLDVAGHYGRNDIFDLRIDRRPRAPVTFDDG